MQLLPAFVTGLAVGYVAGVLSGCGGGGSEARPFFGVVSIPRHAILEKMAGP
jgi:hypothetical protein